VRGEKIGAGREDSARTIPPRRDQRDAARKRFERPNGRHAGQRVEIRTPRDVHRHGITGEDFRRVVVRQPSAVGDARARQPLARRRGIADAIERRAEAERFHWRDQKFLQLRRPLIVAPVADPHHVAVCRACVRLRVKAPLVGCFVPRPRAICPAALEIEIPEGVAEREYAVVAAQVVSGHARRIGHRTVMRVVEQQSIRRRATMVRTDRGHERRLGPLVDHHEIGIAQRGVEVDRFPLVRLAAQTRIGAMEAGDRLVAVIAMQVGAAPAVERLQHAHLVSAIQQLAHHAAEEMRVAVIPVRDERVVEHHDAHAILRRSRRAAAQR
jgi:hypothetical protein